MGLYKGVYKGGLNFEMILTSEISFFFVFFFWGGGGGGRGLEDLSSRGRGLLSDFTVS